MSVLINLCKSSYGKLHSWCGWMGLTPSIGHLIANGKQLENCGATQMKARACSIDVDFTYRIVREFPVGREVNDTHSLA